MKNIPPVLRVALEGSVANRRSFDDSITAEDLIPAVLDTGGTGYTLARDTRWTDSVKQETCDEQ